MKTLLVLRHAKADPGGRHHDLDRDLVPRGEADARRLGERLAAAGQAPDVALVSPATRARRTLDVAREEGWRCRVEIEEDFYGGGPELLFDRVRSLDDHVATAMVVGHEPVLSTLVGRLIGGGHVDMPTCGCARVDFAVDHWRDAAPGAGVLQWLLAPKLLR